MAERTSRVGRARQASKELEELEDQTPRAKPIKIGDSIIDIDEYLTRDYADIGEAAEVLPGLIEYISQSYQQAVEDKLNFKLELKSRSAEVFRDIRKPGVWEECGFVGKITEKGIEAAIALDGLVQDITEKLNRKIARCNRLGQMMNTLQVKLDLVRSVEATKRKLVVDGEGAPRRRRHSLLEEEDTDENDET